MKRVLLPLAAMVLAAASATAFAQDEDEVEEPPELRLLNSRDLAGVCYAQLAISGLELVKRGESRPDEAARAQITLLFVGAQFWTTEMGESKRQAVSHWAPGILAEDVEERVPQLAYCADVAGQGLNEMPAKQKRETLASGDKEARRAMRLRPPGHR